MGFGSGMRGGVQADAITADMYSTAQSHCGAFQPIDPRIQLAQILLHMLERVVLLPGVIVFKKVGEAFTPGFGQSKYVIVGPQNISARGTPATKEIPPPRNRRQISSASEICFRCPASSVFFCMVGG